MTIPKKTLALFLALFTCLSLLPAGALAAEEEIAAEEAAAEEIADIEETAADVSEEETPEVTPEPTPEVTPEPTPEPTPEVTPEPTPEPTPEATPEPTQAPATEAPVPQEEAPVPTEHGVDALLDGASATSSSGWAKFDGRWIYYDSNGNLYRNGWLKSGGKWYYFSNSYMVYSTVKKIDGYNYAFNANGVMLTGWQKMTVTQNGKPVSTWSYFKSDGSRAEYGFYKSGSKWYYIYDGYMVANTTKVIHGKTYCFNANGAMITGWQQMSTTKNGKTETFWSYFDSTGARKDNGWYIINNKWYNFRDGVMLTGWQTLSDGTYFIQSDGTAYSGWATRGNNWFYFDSTGRMRTGWKVVNGYTYYFYKESDAGTTGAMAVSTTIDGYAIDSEGHASVSTKNRMIMDAQGYNSSTSWLIMVDTTGCKLGVFTGSEGNWSLYYYWDCAPGKTSTPTSKGIYQINYKGYYFDSGSARCYYFCNFHNYQAIHSILYYQGGGVMNSTVGMRLSHGCVRLATSNAKWIYDNCPVGTTVVTY